MSTPIPTVSRQTWIDVLKGIGILAVVVGHVTFNQKLVALIFMFHMPLFFLAGGWLHDAGAAPRTFFASKARSLLLPYACYLVVLWPLELAMSQPAGQWGWSELLMPMLYGGRMLTGAASVLWFVTCYFLTQQLAHAMLRRLALPACLTICAALLAVAYGAARLFPGWSLPWAADVVLVALPLYLTGYAARGVALRRWTLVWLAVAAAAIALNLAGFVNTMDMKSGRYGIPLVTLVSSVAVVALLAVGGQALAGGVAARLLSAFGAASMTIMFLHQLVQLAIAKQLGIMQAGPRIVGALAVCYAAHLAINAWPSAARLLLGRRSQGAAA